MLLTLIFCLLAAAYSYFLYPVLLLLLPARRRSPSPQSSPAQTIAVIIAARNEADKIETKLDNTLALTRRNFLVDLIVASDASDDATDSIVHSYADRGVRLVRSPERHGKEHAQGLAISATDADLLVFTDAGTLLTSDALMHLQDRFSDPSVGAVSSVDRFLTADGSLQGEGAYVRYEMWLRDLESEYFSLVGLSGSFFAARHEVCRKWDDRVQSDFGTALNCVRLGLRAISDRNLIGYYKNISDPHKEYERKVRTVTRGMNSLIVRADVLNFRRYGRFSFEVLSHKVMRWATPWFLLAALAASAALAPRNTWYSCLFALQLAFYALPLVSRLAPGLRRFSLTRIGIYFVEANAAIVHATVLVLSGRSILTWEPSKR